MRTFNAQIIDASHSSLEPTMRVADASKSTRKPTNVSLDSALLKEAKSLGTNISRSAEAVRLTKEEQWLKQNAEALQSSNAFVEANGLPLAKHRRF
jgi:antitoxin CcdA